MGKEKFSFSFRKKHLYSVHLLFFLVWQIIDCLFLLPQKFCFPHSHFSFSFQFAFSVHLLFFLVWQIIDWLFLLPENFSFPYSHFLISIHILVLALKSKLLSVFYLLASE